MQQRLTFRTALLLAFGPLMWAGNAVVRRVGHTLVPPVTLNFMRWAFAFALALAILLPLGGWVLKRGSGLWPRWRRFALLGLLGVGQYNARQTSSLQRMGTNVAGVFINLMPLFATVLSTAFLGEWPQPYHGLAFALIVGGILVSARR